METQAHPSFEEVIGAMLDRGGPGTSDLLFVTGQPPQVEINGELTPVEIAGLFPALQPEQIAAFAETIITGVARLEADLKENGSCDTSYSLPGKARFRVNIFRQCGKHAIVMRKLSTEIPSITALGLTPIFREIVKEKTGIIFCTGATGSGKTTTLAAMLNEVNETQRVHVVTLEDPVEFLHPQKNATFSQRELGRDYSSFSMGLRAALRQAPKIILVGEIRDRETMEIALTAAETGHIVYSTLHTISAGQSIHRIVGMFEQGEQGQVRERLGGTLRYIISQRLAPKIGGGRQLLTEIMGNNMRTREIIQLGENDNRNVMDAIEAGVTLGWHSFEQKIIEHYENGQITEETGLAYAVNKTRIRQMLDAAKKRSGRNEEGPHNMRLKHLSEEPRHKPAMHGALAPANLPAAPIVFGPKEGLNPAAPRVAPGQR